MTKEECNCEDNFPKKLAMVGVTIVLVWLLISFLGSSFGFMKPAQTNYYLSQQPVKDLISVNGNAKTTVPPDIARISVSVETNDSKANIAQEENAKITANVYAALTKLGVSKDKIQTTYFSTQPINEWMYVCPNSKDICDSSEEKYREVFLGYKTTNSIYIETSDLKNVGNLLDALTNAGATRIDGVSFDLSEPKQKEIKGQLITEAVKDAKSQAEKIASASGVSIGKPNSISQSYYYQPVSYENAKLSYGAALSDYVSATTVSGGTLDVSISVSASFEIS